MKPHYQNYRKYYEHITKSKIPKDCVVHHLDGDRWNCEFENLLAIDKFIHRNYHKALIAIHKGIKKEDMNFLYENEYEIAKKEYDKRMKLKEVLQIEKGE